MYRMCSTKAFGRVHALLQAMATLTGRTPNHPPSAMAYPGPQQEHTTLLGIPNYLAAGSSAMAELLLTKSGIACAIPAPTWMSTSSQSRPAFYLPSGSGMEVWFLPTSVQDEEWGKAQFDSKHTCGRAQSTAWHSPAVSYYAPI
jgi:hypothetical protein